MVFWVDVYQVVNVGCACVYVQVKSSPGIDDDGYETAGKKPLPRKQPSKDAKKDAKKVCD